MQILRKPFWIIGGVLLLLFSARGQQQWQWKASLPSPRQGMAAAVLENKIYVIGGSETEMHGLTVVQAYDVQQDEWETNIDPLNVARTNSAAVFFEGKVYVFGGRDHNQIISEVEMYDPLSNQWTVVSQLPTPREGLSAVVVDSLVWVIGGAAFQANYNIVECYNPAANSWETLPQQLTVPRVASVAAVINGEVYVFGGFYFGPLNSYEKYVPGSGWTNVGNMSYSCGSASGTEVNGKMWIVGGENHEGILATTQYTGPAFPGTWNTGPPLQLQRKNLSVARVGNYLFAMGGRSAQHTGGLTEAVEALEVVTGIIGPPGTNPVEDFYLKQNFPNPFNSRTSFEVYFDKPATASIGVSNILGQTVRHIYRGEIMGRQRFEFDGRDDFGRVLPSGNYFIYLMAGGEKRVIKATLSK